jgi:molecular chaperone Hsp33
MSNDYLQKFIFENLAVNGCLVRLEASWQEIRQRARPTEDTRELLGQALCAAAVLGSYIKFDGTVSLQIQSSGALRLLLGQCALRRFVRGIVRKTAQPELQTPEQADVIQPLLKDAVLSINLEPEESGVPYQGIVSMAEGSLSKALEYYFHQSEQLETRFWFATSEWACAGFMLQRMPSEEVQSEEFDRLVQLASTLQAEELAQMEPARLLRLLFNEDDVKLFAPEPLKFGCRCSTERVAGVLQSLGEAEMQSLLDERGTVDVNCEYCGKDYRFDRIDIASLFSNPAVKLELPQGLQ